MRRARPAPDADPPQVLEVLLSSHKPLGAYEIIDRGAQSGSRPAPITVYRALDFLIENGLAHRIESRNAFIGCVHQHADDDLVVFLICERCGEVGEASSRRSLQRSYGGARRRLFAQVAGDRDLRHLHQLPMRRMGVTTTERRRQRTDGNQRSPAAAVDRDACRLGRPLDADGGCVVVLLRVLGLQPGRGEARAAGDSAVHAGGGPLDSAR